MAFIKVVIVNTFNNIGIKHKKVFVTSPGIEPGSEAPETSVLSIVLRGHIYCTCCNNPGALAANIFTAIASNITPKNFLTAVKPLFPNNFDTTDSDFKTV